VKEDRLVREKVSWAAPLTRTAKSVVAVLCINMMVMDAADGQDEIIPVLGHL
jgi:hypothetical protein